MKSILVIINPAAGSRSAGEVRTAVENCFPSSRVKKTIYETTGDEDLPAVVRQHLQNSSFDLVLAAGGDGTVTHDGGHTPR